MVVGLRRTYTTTRLGGVPMFQFLFGVAIGAAGYWAWQSFGRDLLGMGGDQGESTYGGFSSSPGGTSFGSSSTAGGSMGSGTGTSSGGTTTSGSGAGTGTS